MLPLTFNRLKIFYHHNYGGENEFFLRNSHLVRSIVHCRKETAEKILKGPSKQSETSDKLRSHPMQAQSISSADSQSTFKNGGSVRSQRRTTLHIFDMCVKQNKRTIKKKERKREKRRKGTRRDEG